MEMRNDTEKKFLMDISSLAYIILFIHVLPVGSLSMVYKKCYVNFSICWVKINSTHCLQTPDLNYTTEQ